MTAVPSGPRDDRADEQRDLVARWAADPGEPITDEDWHGFTSGYRAFLRSRADLLLDALTPFAEARAVARAHQELRAAGSDLHVDPLLRAADYASYVKGKLDARADALGGPS